MGGVVANRPPARGSFPAAVKLSSGRTTALAGLWVLRLGLSGVFVYAGALKIRDPQSFAESVASFRLLPVSLINPAALTLPVLEVLAGLVAWGAPACGRGGALVC